MAHNFVYAAAHTVAPYGTFEYFFAYNHRHARLLTLGVMSAFYSHQVRTYRASVLVNVAQATMTMKSILKSKHYIYIIKNLRFVAEVLIR